MDLGELLTWVSTVCLAVVLAASAGLRAWLPLLITALLARFELLRLGESFEFLASTPALVLFSLATAIEIVGDKIPAVDHVLDLLSTVVRPAAGALHRDHRRPREPRAEHRRRPRLGGARPARGRAPHLRAAAAAGRPRLRALAHAPQDQARRRHLSALSGRGADAWRCAAARRR